MELVKNLKLIKEDVMAFIHDTPNLLQTPGQDLDERQKKLVRELKENGIAALPNYFDRERMLEIVNKAQSCFANDELTDTNYRDGVLYNRIVKRPLHDIPEFLDLILDPYLLAVIRAYFGRRIVLAESSLEQLPPSDQVAGSYKWHFDIRGKQLKMMIMLSDVGEDGQHFSFVPGTHVRRSYLSQGESRFTDEDLKQNGWWEKVVNCTGTIGTVLLFDTNGIHRGTRKPTTTRENITSNFNTGFRHLYPLHISKESAAKLTDEQKDVVRLLNE